MSFWRKPIHQAAVMVQNGTETNLLFIFEPWCWTADLAPGQRLYCHATATREGCLEVEYTKDSITVHSWDTSVAKVIDTAGKVLADLSIPVPDFVGLDEKTARAAK